MGCQLTQAASFVRAVGILSLHTESGASTLQRACTTHSRCSHTTILFAVYSTILVCQLRRSSRMEDSSAEELNSTRYVPYPFGGVDGNSKRQKGSMHVNR